jgi:hypothetical protein
MEKVNLKIVVIALLGLFLCSNLNAQSFNQDKTSFSNFLKRMYLSSPFEGVKIVDDYNHQYLVSVISIEKAKYSSESVMNRVAQVKAQSQASTFINGANISMDMVITTRETKDSSNKSLSTITETVESIKQNAVGFSKGLELLTNFRDNNQPREIFIYAIKLGQ